MKTIAEALNKILELDSSGFVRIIASRKIIDYPNILIHAYLSLSDSLVRGIVEEKLPTLDQEVAQLLEEDRSQKFRLSRGYGDRLILIKERA